MNQIKNRGFSLIELMIAMFIGVTLLLGLVALFTNSSALNKAQSGLARLQENGRFAMARIKNDIEQAGQMHCASIVMPIDAVSNWNQGYETSIWYAEQGFNFGGNGLPSAGDVLMDTLGSGDDDQFGDSAVPFPPPPATVGYYPIDRRFLMQGHECGGACTPGETSGSTLGGDWLTDFRTAGSNDGDRAIGTDIITVRYLSGGYAITGQTGNNFTLLDAPSGLSGAALISDCTSAFIDNASWGGASVTLNNQPPNFNIASNARAFSIEQDLRTVSYFVGVDTDPSDPSRLISSLYRSENGNTQQLVEGVERLDFFYLAQLQTGEIARMTADEVHTMSGGDGNLPTGIGGSAGCTKPPRAGIIQGYQVANDQGCLWRSIYAVEVNLLMNTVADSAGEDDETFIYSPDGVMRQDPSGGIASGIDPGRMYRREFSAVIPIRSYTL